MRAHGVEASLLSPGAVAERWPGIALRTTRASTPMPATWTPTSR